MAIPQKIYFPANSTFLTRDTRATRWAVPYTYECLNARIGILLDGESDAIRGKTILDTGSHIGTFSYAALELGAAFVQGVDSEQNTIKRCLDLFEEHKVADSSYRFDVEDIFTYLERAAENSFDTVLCFGILYYTPAPYRLLQLLARVARETILIDTFTAGYAAIQGKDASFVRSRISDNTFELPILLASLTQPEKKDYRLPQSFSRGNKDLSLMSLPTPALLEIWFQSLGMTFKLLDWSDYIQNPCSLNDLVTPEQKKTSHWADVYGSGIRVSYRLTAGQ